MPSASPSPAKRLSMSERASSTQSLSSSGKAAAAPKAPRTHVVTRHSRNMSHGKGLSKLGKVNSGANLVGEGKAHQRKKSAPATPSSSPRSNVMKRNSSHVALPKNKSHSNLRKNQSATALALNRNTSHGALQKLGPPPTQKPKAEDQKAGVFDLGDRSSGEDNEEEWEDSTTQSPELTRNNSKASTPVRAQTPNGDPTRKLPDERTALPDKVNRPSGLQHQLDHDSVPSVQKPPPKRDEHLDSAPLHQNERSSRAPPAMSTATARVDPGQVERIQSIKSIPNLVQVSSTSPQINIGNSGTAVPSSGSVGVSHFLPTGETPASQRHISDVSDEDAPTGFMSSYELQSSESPEKRRSMLNTARLNSVPSRTQQRLELQRREVMRGSGGSGAVPPAPSLGLNLGSSLSLHSRSASKGRARSLAGERKAVKQEYEIAVKQLTVVRRFRNPVLDSLCRLKEADVLPTEIGTPTPAGPQSKSRPSSRRGTAAAATANGSVKAATANSPEDRKLTTEATRKGNQAPSRVKFQMSRQGSHDDILTTSQGSPEVTADEQDGISAEEALVRRMWESRVVYEPDNAGAIA